MDAVYQLFQSITLSDVIWGLSLFAITFAVSLGLVTLILVKIPATYFHEDHPRDLWVERSAAFRYTAIIVKNILGVLLIALGIVLSLPGVPGQGLLTILLGIMLVDFPGKRQLERRLISRPNILSTVNRLRHRFGKPALVLE